MQYRFHDHGQITDAVRATAMQKAQAVERRLTHIADDLQDLDVTVEYRHHDDTFIAKVVLAIPAHTLPAHGEAPTAAGALGLAFDDINDQLDEALAKMRGEPRIRRQQLAWRLPSAQLARDEAAVERAEEEDAIAEDLDQLAAEYTAPTTPDTAPQR